MNDVSSNEPPSALRVTLYCVPNAALATATLVTTTMLILAGIGFAAIWVGLLVLVFATLWVRSVARVQRRWLRSMTRVEIEAPYRGFTGRNPFRRLRERLTEPATWRDLAFVVLNFPASVLLCSAVAAAWAYPCLYATMVIWAPFTAPGHGPWLPFAPPAGSGFGTFLHTIPYSALGIVSLIVVYRVLPWLTLGYGAFAASLLGPTRASRLRAPTEQLQASRARGVDAAEVERRRIERDLHDGAQHRLVTVAMGVDRARSKLDADPESARALFDEAHAPTCRAYGERMRVVLAEDSVLLRTGVRRLLADEGIETVAEASDGESLLPAVTEHGPDLAIVDVRMPPTFTDEGLRAALGVRERFPGFPVLVLSQYVEERYAVELISDGGGGLGYLQKERVADVADFVTAVRKVGDGGTAIDPEVVTQLLARSRPDPIDPLTPREREVLALMAQGASDAAICEHLVVSGGAVEKHVGNIFAKLSLEVTTTEHRRVRAVLACLERR